MSDSPTAEYLDLAGVKRKHALRHHSDAPADSGADTKYIIEGVVPQRQFGLTLGDSGLGKSPLLYQAGICASAGVPFIGQKTIPSDVLYFDFENGSEESRATEERIARFLGLEAVPESFMRWNADDCAANFDKPGYGIEDAICDWSRSLRDNGRPKLTIVDPLRFWLRQIEDARHADEEVQRVRRIIREATSSVLGIHHLRRVSGEAANQIPTLETDPRRWIQMMCRGAQAMVNGSDVRLGFDYARSQVASDRDALILAGFRRVRGQVGPIYVERVVGEDGEPCGYERIVGCHLLGNPEQEGAFGRLPERFTFKEAKSTYAKTDNPTSQWLKKCEAFGLIRKPRRGQYEKVSANGLGEEAK